MESFSEIIGAWETGTQFAEDVGVPYVTAAAWRQRNSIPSERWEVVVESAAKRGYPGITLELLARIAKTTGDAKRQDPAMQEAS